MRTLGLPSDSRAVVRYLDRGQGEPLVLLHGVGLRAGIWAPQLDRLARTHRTIAPDLPGHGGSTGLAAGAELADFVAWLHEVLTALDCGPVNLAGHSMGALIAGGYQALYPGQLRRVALLNGVWRRSERARAAVRARARAIAAGAIDCEIPLHRWFGDDARHAAARDAVRRLLQEVDPQGYATAYGAFAHGDATYADAWQDCRCPALFLTGADDPHSTPDMALGMAAAAPAGVCCIIPGHRHMVSLTAPEEVNAAMGEWLAMPEPTPQPHAADR